MGKKQERPTLSKKEVTAETIRIEALKKLSIEEIVARVKGEALNADLKEGEALSKERIPTGDEYIKTLEEKESPEHVMAYKKVLEVARIINDAGGKALLVGGSVRDMFMGKIPKDFDIEVYKLPSQSLNDLLIVASEKMGGYVKEVGKAFGITKVVFTLSKLPGEDKERQVDLDISIPRTDSKTGDEHTDFEIELKPDMTIKDAGRRRDFTMNSIAADPLTGDLFDAFGGVKDIRARALRVTDEERFKDDALRVLRAVQFIGRYGLSVDKNTSRIIAETTPGLKTISNKRFGEEWEKLLLKSEQPSYGLIAGMLLGVFNKETFPEFVALTETLQEYEWHPEGDVWIHTLMVVDEAAKIAKRENLNKEDTKALMYSALCHDLGKATTTEFIEGKLRSRGHEQAGGDPTAEFLDKIAAGSDELKLKIKTLVQNHLIPHAFYTAFELGKKDPKGAIRRLAKRIYPATIKMLALLGEADHRGRGPYISKAESGEYLNDEGEFVRAVFDYDKDKSAPDPATVYKFTMPEDYPAGKWLLKTARELKVDLQRPTDVLTGKMFVALGFKGGKGADRETGITMGEIIRIANDLRDEAVVNSRGEKLDSKERIFAELVKWYDEPYPHPSFVKSLTEARDILKDILEKHRASKPAEEPLENITE
jgi:tRNA nucleotidyltransferase (CCA-adding enzyme)